MKIEKQGHTINGNDLLITITYEKNRYSNHIQKRVTSIFITMLGVKIFYEDLNLKNQQWIDDQLPPL